MKSYRKIGKFIELNKHIAIVTPGFAKDENDTTCIPALQDFVLSLSRTGVKVTVFSLHYPFFRKEYVWNNVKIISLGGQNRKLFKKRILAKRLSKKFEEIHLLEPFDLVHSFWLNECTYFAQKTANGYGIPLVASAQGQDALPKNKYLDQLNSSTTVTTMSQFQKKILDQSKVHSEVVCWGTFSSVASNKEYDIVAVGSLIPLKNYNYLLKLFKELKAVRPDFKALIIGEGIERKKIEKLIFKYDLVENVHCLGLISREETKINISKSKILIHPSKYEGFGMVLIEALSSATHVLSSPVGYAFESDLIHLLSFDVKDDLSKIEQLITALPPKAHLIDINTTVRAYLEIYNSIS